MKVLDIIMAAERAINAYAVDDDLPAEEANAAFQLLNGMVDDWANQRFACYQLVTDQYDMLANQATYSIGADPAADFNGVRPTEIDSMFVRDSSQPNNLVDYPITLVTNDMYQSIMLKTVNSTYPYLAMYVTSYPLGALTFFPAPTIPLKLFLTRWFAFNQFKQLTDTVAFPPGYYMTLVYGLAELLPTLGHNSPIAVMARVEALARKYMANVKRVNMKEPVVATIDPTLTGRAIGFPNILVG